MHKADQLLRELVEDSSVFVIEEADKWGLYYRCTACRETTDTAGHLKHQETCPYQRAKNYLISRPPFIIEEKGSDDSLQESSIHINNSLNSGTSTRRDSDGN